MSADVILAKELQRLVPQRDIFVSERVYSLSPGDHAVLLICAVLRFDVHIRPSNGMWRAYITPTSAQSTTEDTVAFKPNYGRDRTERTRAARTRNEEKQRKKDEKTAMRKAQRLGAKSPTGETTPPSEEKQS